VHRDLKPENVFLTKDGRVKILDFGLAKLKMDGAESGHTDMQTVSGGTQPGVVLGTMGYMSPEQVRGKSADKRSDIFSFGTILYEMLSGQRAFRGDTAADTITAILTKEPPTSRRRTRTSIRVWTGSCATAWRRTRRSVSSRRATSPSIWRRFRVSRRRR
jgi:serine/threonine protein kinase